MLQDSILHTNPMIPSLDSLAAGMAVENGYQPVETIWPGSYTAVCSIENITRAAVPSFIDSLTNLGLVLFIILFFLFAFVRIAEGLHVVILSVFNYKKLFTIETQTNLHVSRDTLLIFSLILSAFIFANYNAAEQLFGNHYPLGINFAIISAGILFYFLFRRIFFALLSWTNRTPVLKYLDRFFYTYIIFGIFLSFLGFIVYFIFPEIGLRRIAVYMSISAILTIFIYFIRGYQIIISNGFSHFFWILYLCTLEILPLLIVAHIILS